MSDAPKTLASRVPFKAEIETADGGKRNIPTHLTVIGVKKPEGAQETVERKKGNKESNLKTLEKQETYLDKRLLPPPYNISELVYLEEVSNVLRECIDAMVVNVEGFGHTFRARETDEAFQDKFNQDIKEELRRAEAWVTTLGVDISLVELRKRMRRDLELSGNGYWEIVKNKKDTASEIHQIPTQWMRLSKQDEDFTKMTIPLVETNEESGYVIKRKTVNKRFRRFVQVDSSGKALVWFKEYGDPRLISKLDGKVVPEEDRKKFPRENRANEVIHFKIYSPRTPYGIPRHIGRYPSILGSRRSEEVNFFSLDNHIPSMFIMVENGSLTDASIQRLQELIETQVSPDPNYSKFILLEAEADINEIIPGQVGAPSITVKSMHEAQRTDEMFQKYDRNNQDKVRQAWRLPPLFIGRSDDYTRATALTSRRVADEQIFAPERETVDSWMNRLMLDANYRFFIFKSRTPNVTDNETLVRMMMASERSGGMNAERCNTLMNDVFEGTLGPMPEGIDLNIPYSLQFAQAQNAQRPPEEFDGDPHGRPAMDGAITGTNNDERSAGDWVDNYLRSIENGSD